MTGTHENSMYNPNGPIQKRMFRRAILPLTPPFDKHGQVAMVPDIVS